MHENACMGLWTQVGENLVRHKGGSYYLRAWVNGKVIRTKLDAKDLRIAKIQRDTKLEKLRSAARLPITSNVRTVGEAIDVVAIRVDQPHLTEPTRDYYAAIIEILRKTLPVEELAKGWTATEATDWWRKITKAYAPQRANNALSMCKKVGEVIVECGLRADNPAGKLRRVKVTSGDLNIPSKDVVDRIIETIGAQGKRASKESAAYVGFLAYGGCRHGQAHSLQWEDIEFADDGGWIQFRSGIQGTKGAQTRRLPISAPLKKVLEEYRPEGAVGKVFKIKTPRIALENACKRLEVPHVRLHDLRHFFGTYAIECGVDIPTVAKWLGHKDGGALLLKTYMHVRDHHSAASAKKLI